MQVNGPGNVHSAHGLSGPHFRNKAAATQAPTAQPADKLEISAEATEAARLSEIAETRASEHVKDAEGVRTGLVQRLRGEIAAGTYESADKLDAALDRVLDEIG
ncbi:MAG: flagellar biosynthesis anti-sigma factor FlgM [Planctomycetota bacterium]